MITTQTNLRATATEAYLKGEADAYSSENLRTLLAERAARSSFNEARMLERGANEQRAIIVHQLLDQASTVGAQIEQASTRWEKRLLTGRLEGIGLALEAVQAS